MVPSKLNIDNHAVIWLQPHTPTSKQLEDPDLEAQPFGGTLHFACRNKKITKDEYVVIRARYYSDAIQKSHEAGTGAKDKRVASFQEALTGIVSLLTKLEPQIWGYNPSALEIPFLLHQMQVHNVPPGVLAQNPPPGRGFGYHKDFMDGTWNAQPRHFISFGDDSNDAPLDQAFGRNYLSTARRCIRLTEAQREWVEEMKCGPDFGRFKKSLDVNAPSQKFDSKRDGDCGQEGLDEFDDLINVLNVTAVLMGEKPKEL